MVRISQVFQPNANAYVITPHDLPTGITLPYEVTPAWVYSAYTAARTDANASAQNLDLVLTWEGTWQIASGSAKKTSNVVQDEVLSLDESTLLSEIDTLIQANNATFVTAAADPAGGSSPNALYNQQYWLEGLRRAAIVTRKEDYVLKLQELIEDVIDAATLSPSGHTAGYYGFEGITSSLSYYQWAHAVVRFIDDAMEGRIPLDRTIYDWLINVIVWVNDNVMASWHLAGEVTNFNNQLAGTLTTPTPTDVSRDKMFHAIAVDAVIEKAYKVFATELAAVGSTYVVKSGGTTFNKIQTGTATSSNKWWRAWFTQTHYGDTGFYDTSNGDLRWEENNLFHAHYVSDGDHPYWDTAHANRHVEYVDTLLRAGLGDKTLLREHMNLMARTYSNRMWNGSGSPDIRFSNYIDGTSTVYLSGTHGTDGVASINAIMYPGWDLLGAYDPLAQYLLDQLNTYVDLSVNDSGMYQRMSAPAAEVCVKAGLLLNDSVKDY